MTLGCCTNLADFYRRVGAGEKIHFYDRLFFADARAGGPRFKSSILPPPLHMAPAFLFFSALTFTDKRGIARALLTDCAGRRNAAGYSTGISMLDWLHRKRQTPAAIERFWRVVLVSALDEELARDGGSLRNRRVLEGVSGKPRRLPRGCSGRAARRSCTRVVAPPLSGAAARCGCAQPCSRNPDRGRPFFGRDPGRWDRMSRQMLCVARRAARRRCSKCSEGNAKGASEGLRHLKTSPITGVHFWFDRTVMTVPFLALLDNTVQWIFNKSMLYVNE